MDKARWRAVWRDGVEDEMYDGHRIGAKPRRGGHAVLTLNSKWLIRANRSHLTQRASFHFGMIESLIKSVNDSEYDVTSDLHSMA